MASDLHGSYVTIFPNLVRKNTKSFILYRSLPTQQYKTNLGVIFDILPSQQYIINIKTLTVIFSLT